MITSTYLEIANVKQEPESDCFRVVSFNINAQLFVRNWLDEQIREQFAASFWSTNGRPQINGLRIAVRGDNNWRRNSNCLRDYGDNRRDGKGKLSNK